MRVAFHRELENLDRDVVRMGALVEQATQLATRALEEGNAELARKVQEGDTAIDNIFLDIEKRCLTLLAQQAPVAADLRLIVAILRVVNDLERAGDLAYNIAKLVEIESFREPGLKKVRGLVFELGEAAAQLLGEALDAWARKDEQKAAEISRQDDRIDQVHARLLEELVSLREQDIIAPALRLVLVARYFERIGDHAVNLAERLRYFITGDEDYLG